jgi:predicted NBD/HSP70 family sugar kinase
MISTSKWSSFKCKKSSKIAVINVLLEKGPLSRPEIIKQTSLSQTSIHEVTKELVDRGILLERGIGESSGGRKPVLLEVSTEVGFALGIKVDANGITTAVVDLLGNIVHRSAAPLPESRNEESITAKIADTITNAINESGKQDCLTALASDQYVIDQTQKLLEKGKASRLQNQLGEGESPSVDLIIKGALAGDSVLSELYKSWIYHLALGIDNLIRIFDPQLILVERESVPTEPELIETLTGNLEEINKLSYYSNVKLMPFSLEKDGWNIGAADLIFQKVIREPLHNRVGI